jgi:hypothetical protein
MNLSRAVQDVTHTEFDLPVEGCGPYPHPSSAKEDIYFIRPAPLPLSVIHVGLAAYR